MSYINRIQVVLAEECNNMKVNGITTWEPHDFYEEARKFVAHIQSITLMSDTIGINSYQDAKLDMVTSLEWSIPEGYHSACIEAGLDELYDELSGDA